MANDADMKRLREALRTDGERVEIHRHIGGASSDSRTASESAEHIARVMDVAGRVFECGVSAGQVLELEQLGAKVFG